MQVRRMWPGVFYTVDEISATRRLGVRAGRPGASVSSSGPTIHGAPEGRLTMPTWLLILIVGVVLLVLGVAVEAAKLLIWIGVAVLIVSLVLGLLGRGRSRT